MPPRKRPEFGRPIISTTGNPVGACGSETESKAELRSKGDADRSAGAEEVSQCAPGDAELVPRRLSSATGEPLMTARLLNPSPVSETLP
jgi:hypothetical protein